MVGVIVHISVHYNAIIRLTLSAVCPVEIAKYLSTVDDNLPGPRLMKLTASAAPPGEQIEQ